MTRSAALDLLVRTVESHIGPPLPFDEEEFAAALERNPHIFPSDDAEWDWEGNQLFAHDYLNDTVELLAVITAVDPTTDFTELARRVGTALPDNFEIEVSEPELGSPVLLALVLRGGENLDAEYVEREVASFLQLASQLLDAVSA